MKDNFLKLKDHNDVASYFGLTYADLTKIIYTTHPEFKYHIFEIPKKNGEHRRICSPSKKLKLIQVKLKDVLYEIYPTKQPAHGFAKNKSIVTNAKNHLDKKFIFNIDLSDFFGTISFGRIRNLFGSSPFNFNDSVSTILAQICCFDNSLPQGAPTSPILSNMIAYKLDSQLLHLAKKTNSTYTRYADDISFSFTCNFHRLPNDIVIMRGHEGSPGDTLTKIIEGNGFKINHDKVRLCSKYSRMEVTGLTVNEFPNVRRKYIRQISSMLHAWRKHTYEKAEKEYNDKYNNKHRPSGKPKSFLHVVKGKLLFLKSVKSNRDPIYTKLAKQYNDLVGDEHKLEIVEITAPEQNAMDSLWVLEAYSGSEIVAQGTGFQLKDVGIVTCAHVVANDDKKIVDEIVAYKHSDTTTEYRLNVDKICFSRDAAICSIQEEGKTLPASFVEKSNSHAEHQQYVKLMGFPAYAPGHTCFVSDSKVAMIYPAGGVKKFEIDTMIRDGNSGGPILNADSQVVGIALEGATKESGKNGCLMISELENMLKSDDFNV